MGSDRLVTDLQRQLSHPLHSERNAAVSAADCSVDNKLHRYLLAGMDQQPRGLGKFADDYSIQILRKYIKDRGMSVHHFGGQNVHIGIDSQNGRMVNAHFTEVRLLSWWSTRPAEVAGLNLLLINPKLHLKLKACSKSWKCHSRMVKSTKFNLWCF